jgi:formate/nitrite transporter FocA (FNT family)
LYILGGVLLAVGILLWIAVQKKFEKDIQEYKTLISEILDS